MRIRRSRVQKDQISFSVQLLAVGFTVLFDYIFCQQLPSITLFPTPDPMSGRASPPK